MTPHQRTAESLGLTTALADELSVCLDVALAGDGVAFYANSPQADALRERGFIAPTQQEDADGEVGHIYRFTDRGRAAVSLLFGVDLAPAPTPTPPRLAPVVRLDDRRPKACSCGGKGGAA